ncbi:sensor histidine kinase [Nocardia sp. NBC_01503]|uniref:sensor histidine kinase n=1 Tax=Nocardia sp. NBC_01503 TaxID=2975997 RepID=UPI002E7AC7CF|nr:sensor histidine kinase [Nocardia sp. NBC_01503]WTL30126.1 sensor histidine kinase [Nocardia sp. NBC_01503]
MTQTSLAVRPGPAPLRWWQEGWRQLVVILFAVLSWIIAKQGMDAGVPSLLLIWLCVVDPILGVCCLVLVLFRRRWPVAVAAVTTAVSAVSTTASGPSILALCSLATRRRLREILPIAVVGVLAGMMMTRVYPEFNAQNELPGSGWYTLAFLVVAMGAIVAVGVAVGSRREVIWSLQQRTEIAEREQVARATEARILERHRIAREMHDVLAHRISLVAMQAGVLTYRPDLSSEQVGSIAQTIAENSRQALEELRDVLGVLRADELHATDPPEPPQPSLAALPTLVADARDSGLAVTLTDKTEADPPVTSARTAYRIVQEGLTNVGKHAPGATVWILLDGAPGEGLTVSVSDSGAPGATEPAPRSGYGLLGLTERAELVGGTLAFGARPQGGFTLRATLPWPQAQSA